MERLRTLARLGAATLVLLPALGAASGCSTSTETSTATTVVPTSIVVDPRSFLGDLPCSDEPGAVRSFVATITDDTVCDDTGKACSQDSECCSNACILSSASGQGGSAQGTCAAKTQPFVLPSSPPTSCAHPVYFRYVVPGHVYSAEVDAYPVPPERLVPVGQVDGAWSGSRQMLDATTRQPVTPRWTTTCGETAETGAVAITNANVLVDACAPLADTGSSITAIAVDPRAALTSTGCTGIGTIDVVPDAPTLATALVACTGGPPALYTTGITAGSSYAFTLRAHAAEGGAIAFGARCEALAQTGITVTASCTPFSAEGDVRFDVATLLPGVECAPDVFVEASLAPAVGNGGAIGSGVVACGASVGVGPVAPGAYAGNVTATKAGQVVAQASCMATVMPGVSASCE